MQQGEGDSVAVRLLQEALIQSGFPIPAGATGFFGQQTASAVVAAEERFGFRTDAGLAGREVFGALDLSLRGWNPPPGAHWGGLSAKTIVPVTQRKIQVALDALDAPDRCHPGFRAYPRRIEPAMQGPQNPFPKRNVQPPATLDNH